LWKAHCGGRATTIFVEQQHRLRNVTEHNHAAEASRVTVCEQLARWKKGELPAQIIQTVTTSGPSEIHPYLPFSDALPQLPDFVILNFLWNPGPQHSWAFKNISGSDFLVRDSVIGEDRVLLFTTFGIFKNQFSGSWMEHLRLYQPCLYNYIQFMDVLGVMTTVD